MAATSRSKQTRNSRRRKNLLFYWRKGADLTQVALGEILSLSADQVGAYETDERSVQGQGRLIIRWAEACGIIPTSMQVQEFLYCTGNAPCLPDPYCPQCRAELSACAAHLFERHHEHTSARSSMHLTPQTPNDRRVLMEEITANQQAMPSRHPYAVYTEVKVEQP